jgi:hypothetical protein
LLDQGIRDMETLLARHGADGALFLDGVPKQLLRDLYYLGEFRGMAVYGFFASSQFFVVDAPGGPGLAEFLSARLRQLGREPIAPTAVLLTSCGPDGTAGLLELVQKWHTQVVASPTGVESLRDSCPPGTVVLSALELPGKGWFSVSPIPLRGLGFAPIAYELTWGGKTALFSGRIPRKINHQSGEALIADLTNASGDMRDYFASLTQLQGVKPNLWLPAIPTDCQNANLYESDWERVVEDNLLVMKVILTTPKKS